MPSGVTGVPRSCEGLSNYSGAAPLQQGTPWEGSRGLGTHTISEALDPATAARVPPTRERLPRGLFSPWT